MVDIKNLTLTLFDSLDWSAQMRWDEDHSVDY